MMRTKWYFIIAIVSLLLVFVIGQVLAATSPSLGDAQSFLVFGGSGVTNSGDPSSIAGDVGLYPSTGANITGILPAHLIGGTIYSIDGLPAGSVTDPVLLESAQDAFEAAYDDLSLLPDNVACTEDALGAWELGGETLVPGVYCATVFSLTGTLTLDNTTDPFGVWIFRASLGDTSLSTATDASVVFANEEVDSSCGVWWQVPGTATILSGTSFIGNILAYTSITLGEGASLEGRAFAEIENVTLIHNTITYPICDYQAPPGDDDDDDDEDETPGLPETGSGAVILNEIFSWSLVFFGGIFAIALILGVRSLRRADRLKK